MTDDLQTITPLEAIKLSNGARCLRASICFDSGIATVLAKYDHRDYQPYVTWEARYDPHDGTWDCTTGHYFQEFNDALKDYNKR